MSQAQITIIIVLLLVLIGAIFLFIKTPKNKKYTLFQEDKNSSDSNYVPEYTKQERISFIIKYGSWLLLLFVSLQYYFFPWLKIYAENANCYNYGNINGVHLLMYGVFVFLPPLIRNVMHNKRRNC